MKPDKFINYVKLSVLMAISAIIFTACEKDENNPDYVGTWVATGTMTIEDVTLDYKDIMTFSKNSFTDLGQVKIPGTNTWINFAGLKGTFTYSEETGKMNVIITEVGMTTFDIIGMPTGTIVYYKDGENGFTDLMDEIGMVSTFISEYSISGNTMTLQSDYNNDNDYNDEGETTVYQRQ